MTRLLTHAVKAAQVREGNWKVAPLPEDLLDRRVEITGPTDRKMVRPCFRADKHGGSAIVPLHRNLRRCNPHF